MKARVALTIPIVTALCAAATAHARTTSDPCSFLSARQVAAVHVDTGCTTLRGRPNPLYTGVTATWGKLGGKGSVIVAIAAVKDPSFIALLKSAHRTGTSWHVGRWSRGTCINRGRYCYGGFIVGNNAVTIQVAAPEAKPVSVVKPTKAMAKTIAAKLS